MLFVLCSTTPSCPLYVPLLANLTYCCFQKIREYRSHSSQLEDHSVSVHSVLPTNLSPATSSRVSYPLY